MCKSGRGHKLECSSPGQIFSHCQMAIRLIQRSQIFAAAVAEHMFQRLAS